MLFLATFFPMSELEEEEGGHKFDFFNDFLRATVDMADLVGIYLVMSRLVFLWVGARGVEFDWRYIQKSFEANISLLHFITLSALVWLWGKRNSTSGAGLTGVLVLVLALCCYKGLLVSLTVSALQLSSWGALLQEAAVSTCLGLVSLQLYLGLTQHDKYQ